MKSFKIPNFKKFPIFKSLCESHTPFSITNSSSFHWVYLHELEFSTEGYSCCLVCFSSLPLAGLGTKIITTMGKKCGMRTEKQNSMWLHCLLNPLLTLLRCSACLRSRMPGTLALKKSSLLENTEKDIFIIFWWSSFSKFWKARKENNFSVEEAN